MCHSPTHLTSLSRHLAESTSTNTHQSARRRELNQARRRDRRLIRCNCAQPQSRAARVKSLRRTLPSLQIDSPRTRTNTPQPQARPQATSSEAHISRELLPRTIVCRDIARTICLFHLFRNYFCAYRILSYYVYAVHITHTICPEYHFGLCGQSHIIHITYNRFSLRNFVLNKGGNVA